MFKFLNTDWKAYTFISVSGFLLFVLFIGNIPLFDWDEINFAECAREMLVTGNYSDVQLYFEPFWEKPPLFIWLQAISMNLFGVNEFAARFPNAICGVITLMLLYKYGKTLHSQKFGLIWAFIYASTLLPHLFFKSGIIDPWFNLFIFSSIYFLIKHVNNPIGSFGYKTSLLAGFFLGLALLTKGPAAFILVSLTVSLFFILSRFKKLSSMKFIIVFFIAFVITGLSWFIIEVIKGNSHVIKDFIDYQIRLFKTEDSDHGGPFIYHFVVLLIGCFPASIFLILGHKKSEYDTPFQKSIKKWMLALFWVVLILFSIVQTKIVHYSSLCYFPLTYLATYSILKLLSSEYYWKKWMSKMLYAIASILGLAIVIIGLVPFFKNYIIKNKLIADEFALENLKADVNWLGIEWLIGIVFIAIIFYSIRKIKQGQLKFIYVLFIGSLFTAFSLITFIIPKIEQYSQRSLIEFYKMCEKNNYRVSSLNFKSYGLLFYLDLKEPVFETNSFKEFKKNKIIYLAENNLNPESNQDYYYKFWLLEVEHKGPVCFVAKCNEAHLNENYPMLTELYRKNGYVFFVKMPNKK